MVPVCPTSKIEWDNAALKKNCSKIAKLQNCTTATDTFMYHCVINGYRNETLEVCAVKRIIIGTPYILSNDLFSKNVRQANNIMPFFQDIVQSSMLTGELFRAITQTHAANQDFQNVTRFTAHQMLTNVIF